MSVVFLCVCVCVCVVVGVGGCAWVYECVDMHLTSICVSEDIRAVCVCLCACPNYESFHKYLC